MAVFTLRRTGSGSALRGGDTLRGGVTVPTSTLSGGGVAPRPSGGGVGLRATSPGATIMRVVRGPSGDALTITDSALADYVAQGYVAILSPYVAYPTGDAGAWDSGPTYEIAHADGRRFAVTAANYDHYYAPLGFVYVRGEHGEAVPGAAQFRRLTVAVQTEAGVGYHTLTLGSGID